MKKVVFTILTMLLLTICTFSLVNAASVNITEAPDIKIVIDGNITENTNVPLIINDRTMLPLREVLVKLGVQNDNQHIIWNDKERSITIIKDDVKVNLKVGSTAAYVNNTEITLDAAPVIYEKNNYTYIPVRFVAQALGKAVVWDNYTRSVLIKDQKDFDEIKSILNNVNEAGKSFNKLATGIDIQLKQTSGSVLSLSGNISGTIEVDKDSKTMHMVMGIKPDILPINIDLEYYLFNGKVYYKGFLSEGWEELPLDELGEIGSLDEAFNESLINISVSDLLCAGLTKTAGSNPDEIILKGNVYIGDIKEILDGQDYEDIDISSVKINNYYTEMTINTKTNQIINQIIDISMDIPASIDALENYIGTIALEGFDAQISLTYDYNNDFVINIPDELK